MKPSRPEVEYAKTTPWIAVVVFFLALFHGYCLVQANVDKNLLFSAYMFGDTDHYLTMAQGLIQSGMRDGSPPFHPPGTALYLVGILLISKKLTLAMMTIKMLFSMNFALMAALVTILADRLCGKVAAWTAGILTAFSFGLAVIGTIPSAEILYLICLLMTILLLDSKAKLSPLRYILLGVLSGVGWLIRSEHLLLIPVVACLMITSNGPAVPRLRRFGLGAIFLCVVFLTVSPWSIRNYRVLSKLNDSIEDITEDSSNGLPEIVPVTFYGPLNFSLANLPPASGGFTREALPLSHGSYRLNLFDSVHRRFIIDGYKMGMQALLEDLPRAGALMRNKLDLASCGLANGFTVLNIPGGLAGRRQPIDLFTPGATWFRWVVLISFFVGLGRLFTINRQMALVFLVLIGHRLIVTVMFYGYARHGILLWPFWAVCVGIITTGVFPRNIKKSWSVAVLVLVISCFIGLNVWGVVSPLKIEVDYQMNPATGQADQQRLMEFRIAE